jgi:hypothetical protein
LCVLVVGSILLICRPTPAPVMIITQSSPLFFPLYPKIRLLLLSNVNGLQAKYIAEEGSPRLCVCGAIKSIQGKRTVPSSLTLCVWVDPDVCFCLFADR